MKTRFAKVLVLLTLVVAMVAMMAIPAMATNREVLGGSVTVADSANSSSISGDTVTITAKGSLFGSKTNTVTITNETADTVQLSFDYTASTYNSFTIAGATASASGTYSGVLTAGGTVIFVLKSNSGLSNTTATLTLSNFSITVASASSNVTIEYDSAYGSVTAGGSAVDSNTTMEVSLSDGVEFVATEANGGKFCGWIDSDGMILSTETSYTLKPSADMTVKAVFIGANSKPYFSVGGAAQKSESVGLLGLGKRYYYTVGASFIFDDFNAAVAKASSSNTKYVVLMNDATLPAGDYTIPAGVTLLIPFDNANTLFTTEAMSVEVVADNKFKAPTAYRTLTLAEGANLTINGALSLSAKHYNAAGNRKCGGAPAGVVPFLKMNQGSTITVDNGGALYAYGFITGSGTITAKSGATVYENFQMTDFRGGTQSTDMDNGVFPISQYYIQNIEVPLTLEYGAKEYSYTSVAMSGTTFGSAVNFIGYSGAMFNLTEGSVTKRYDGTTDRLIVDVNNGKMSISPIEMEIGTSDLNSKDYVLPVNGNITVNVNEGSTITITQDVAMLPGFEMHIAKGAEATMGAGCAVYFYDADEWGGYCGAGNQKLIPALYAPGRTYERTAAELKDAKVVIDGTVTATVGSAYTTAGGAELITNGTGKVQVIAGTETQTYQLIQNTGYVTIPVSPAKLKNADGTYLETVNGGSTKDDVRQYIYADGKWVCDTGFKAHTPLNEGTVVDPTCTAGGYTLYTCAICGCEYQVDPTTALGHDEVTDAAVEATCTETGLTEGKHCETCGEVLEAQEVVPANGHTEEIIPGEAATCEFPGLTEGKNCTACGEKLVAQTEIPALGHDEVVDAAVDPTCTDTGLSEGWHCSRCEVKHAQEVVPALGHDEVVTPGTAATCTENGLTDGWYCTRCDAVLEQEVIPSNGHSYSDWNILEAPSYTEAGSKSKTCSGCGDVVTEAIEVLAHPVIGYNIVLGDNIGVNFQMNLNEKDTVTVTVNGNAVDCTVADGKLSIYVAAAQMMDEIAISVNNMPLAKTYSVRAYADYILNDANFTDAEKNLVKAMLVYGGAAQTYFVYNKDNLASKGITAASVAVPTETVAVDVSGNADGITFYGASLVFQSKVAVRFYFTGSSEGIENAVVKGDLFYIEVADINPQDYAKAIELTVEGLTVSYSPLNYIVRMYNKADAAENTKALVQALYGYYVAAAAYAA